jgi:hypothetical protein
MIRDVETNNATALNTTTVINTPSKKSNVSIHTTHQINTIKS